MAIGIGECCRGRITRITAYGAFVALETAEPAVSGMIHISEMSRGYVNDISDLVSVGDEIAVKVLSVDERGRIALSRRQAMPEEEQEAERAALAGYRRRTGTVQPASDIPAESAPAKSAPAEYAPYVRREQRGTVPQDEDGFEKMLRRFRSVSEERLGELRRGADGRRSRRKR